MRNTTTDQQLSFNDNSVGVVISDWRKEPLKTRFAFLGKPWQEINKQNNSPAPRGTENRVAFEQGT